MNSQKPFARTMTRVAVPLTLAALLLAGCSSAAGDSGSASDATPGSMEDLIAAAQAEGELQIYMGPDENAGLKWVQDFTDKYGVEVLTFSGSTADLWQRFTQERQTNADQADIIIDVDTQRYQQAADKGWLMEYTPENDAAYPDDVKNPGLWYGLYTNADPIAWNTDKVTPDEEKLLVDEEYGALADPAFSGRIGIAVPNSGRNLRTWYRLGVLDDQLGDPYLQAVAANKPAFFTSGSALSEQLVAGEYAVAVGVADVQILRAALKGAHVELLYPHPSTGTSFSMAINAGAPHPAAAKLFMEWATSPEALASASVAFQAAPIEGVPDGRDLSSLPWFKAPEDVELGWELDQDMIADSDSFVDHWNQVFGYAG